MSNAVLNISETCDLP